MMILLSLTSHLLPLVLHSFPTRRSSDLHKRLEVGGGISPRAPARIPSAPAVPCRAAAAGTRSAGPRSSAARPRSEEHTSELQSRLHLVCRLLLEKKK